MKNVHKLILLLLFSGTLLVSCSEDDQLPQTAEKASLSFQAVLNDLLKSNKQAIGDLPACSDEEADHVEIVLLQGAEAVVGSSEDPFRIDLVPGEDFTEEVPEMELEPGTYILDHFAVYNADDELIWLAPRGGVLAQFVDDPLPLSISLGAGVKKYVDVPVLCFDDRDVNQYGYLFFDLHPTEAVEFCFFANYCDANGRHFPAAFSVDIWIGTDNTGSLVYSGEENTVSTEGDDPSTEALCLALPDLTEFPDDQDYLYYEVSLRDWPGVYGDVETAVISGTLRRADIQANFVGEADVDYEHLRFGCDTDTGASQFDAEVATSWFDLLTELSRTTYFNPQSTRLFAYSGLSLYEAVVPGMPSYQSIFPELSGEAIESDDNEDLYWPASANAALARIAERLLQNYPQPLDLAAIQQQEETIMANFPASVPEEQLQRSIAFGRQVADQVYEWSQTDGTFSPCGPYVPGAEPGTWVPTPPVPAAGVCQGNLRTFIPDAAQQTLPAPPPAYSTDPVSPFYQMNDMVYQISLTLTPEDHRVIASWRDVPGVKLNGPTHITAIVNDLIKQENLNLAEAAVLLAKQGMAQSDAIAASFYAKYEYTLIRPITYIQNVMVHPEWTSVYPTPPHPSYPAVSPSPLAAVVEILESFFGESYSFEDTTQEAMFGVFSYNSLDAIIDDSKRSRTHSGLNYQLSVDVAEELGRAVGEMVNALDFQN